MTIRTDLLLLLADRLENIPDAYFDYCVWVGVGWGGKADLSCGTKACALGWATTIPEIAATGLYLHKPTERCDQGFVFHKDMEKKHALHEREQRDSIDAAMLTFGLTRADARFLFMPDSHGPDLVLHPGAVDLVSPRPKAKAYEVAAHIRAFVHLVG